jgi:hypothetical protein
VFKDQKLADFSATAKLHFDPVAVKNALSKMRRKKKILDLTVLKLHKAKAFAILVDCSAQGTVAGASLTVWLTASTFWLDRSAARRRLGTLSSTRVSPYVSPSVPDEMGFS